ncbi:hypothetical protein DMN91_011808 [Ooceraea biroi]|uniref:DUF4817 domain-containing protein n=1 Tax=Ooceraea biroi TaxID=2015173 RepID=A0A3L8D6K1_OOCBI|nr:hypothetical protein DMN91_011808 [Ooceraea biroi]
MEYEAREYRDMLIIYGECGQNARRAAQEYNVRFPDRRPIVYGVILRLLYRAEETGRLVPDRRLNVVAERRVRIVHNEEAIMRITNDNPEMSINYVIKSNGVKSGDLASQLIGPTHPIHLLPKVALMQGVNGHTRQVILEKLCIGLTCQSREHLEWV